MLTTQPTTDVAALPPLTRWRRALVALAKVAVDPENTPQVLVFSAHANAGTIQRRAQRFFDDPRARQLFAERRSIDSQTIDLDRLAALPEGTLGRAYAEFLRSRGLTPEIFDGTPPEFSDPRAAYLVQRMRQTHDLWHVVTGFDTTPFGEIALQAFTFGQLGAPSTLILALVGTVKGTRHRPQLAREVWAAFRAGRAAEPLPTFPWEDHWSTPLVDVRTMLGVHAAPRATA